MIYKYSKISPSYQLVSNLITVITKLIAIIQDNITPMACAHTYKPMAKYVELEAMNEYVETNVEATTW